jgi:arginyl-tRNA synthetase
MLSKAGFSELEIQPNNNYSPDDLEYELIKLILQFEDKLEEAKKEYEPFVLARYVLDICRAFNRYYYQEKIIDIDDEIKRKAKLSLVYSSKETIKAVLKVIGIKAPQRM